MFQFAPPLCPKCHTPLCTGELRVWQRNLETGTPAELIPGVLSPEAAIKFQATSSKQAFVYLEWRCPLKTCPPTFQSLYPLDTKRKSPLNKKQMKAKIVYARKNLIRQKELTQSYPSCVDGSLDDHSQSCSVESANDLNQQSLDDTEYQHANNSDPDYVSAARKLLGECNLQKTFSTGQISGVNQKSFELYLKIGELVMALNNIAHRELLSEVLKLALEPNDNMGHLYYPRTESEFQSHYLNTTNTYSLVNKIPIPVVEKVTNSNHSYTNPIKMIEYLSKHCEKSAKNIHTVKSRHVSLIQSKKLKDHFEVCAPLFDSTQRNVIVMILLWSDGFEPNRTKKNRGSAWALTATYIFYDASHSKKVFLVKTKLISLGKDKDDHSSIFARISSEYQSYFQSEGKKSPVPLSCSSIFFNESSVNYYPFMIGCLMDNPERRSNYGLKNGNANNHGYFGLSLHFKKLELPFTPCQDCEKIITDYISAKDWKVKCFANGCQRCIGLSISRLQDYGTYKDTQFTPPLPRDGLNNQDIPGIHLAKGPGFLSSKMLKEGWEYAKKEFLENHWSKTTVKTYLCDLFCINEYQYQRFLEDCYELKRIRKYNGCVESRGSLTELELYEIKRAFDEDPNCEEKLCLPPGLWSLFEPHECYECIMHQAMNSVSAMMAYTFQWAASNGRSQVLVRQTTPKLESVKRVRSSKFEIHPFKNHKLGGYVGENCRTLLAISPWLFSFLDDESMKPTSVEVPLESKTRSSLTVGEIRAWLTVRDIEFDAEKLSKNDLLALAKKYWPPKASLPLSDWKVCQLRAWLASRGELLSDEEDEPIPDQEVGLLTDQEDRESLEVRVRQLQILQTPVRQLRTRSTAECGHILQEMFSTLSSFQASLVSGDLVQDEATNRCEGYAMLFLLKTLAFHRKLSHPSLAETIVFKKCTMFGLLRSTSHFSQIYHMKSLDEGGENGEAYVKIMRPFCKHGLKPNWQQAMQHRIFRTEGLRYLHYCIQPPIDGSLGGDGIVHASYDNRSRIYKSYSTRLDFESMLRLGEVVTMAVYVGLTTFQTGIYLKKGRGVLEFLPVKLTMELQFKSQSYFQVMLSLDATKIVINECDDSTIKMEGIELDLFTVALGLPLPNNIMAEGRSRPYAFELPEGRWLRETSGGIGFQVI